MDHAQIERINELARKKKTVGLTAQELEEQAALRAQYLKEFRANMEDTLSRVRVEQADGTYKPLVKKDKKNGQSKMIARDRLCPGDWRMMAG